GLEDQAELIRGGGAMPVKNSRESDALVSDEADGADLLLPLVAGQPARGAAADDVPGVVVGGVVAITDDGRTPLVVYPGQPGSAALVARSVVDLHGPHIGKSVVLAFDAGDRSRPIIIGLIRDGAGSPLTEKAGTVEVDADGERLMVSAKEQLVL